MATGHPLLAKLRSFKLWHRDQQQPRPSKRYLIEREAVMQFLAETEAEITTLIANRQASDQNAAAEKARADASDAEVATLKAQIAADEATMKTILDKVTAENAAEHPAVADTVTGAEGNDLVHEDPTLGH